MEKIDFKKFDDFEQNKYNILNDKYFSKLIEEVEKIQNFLDLMGDTLFGKDFFSLKFKEIIEPRIVFNSVILTSQSIRLCCKYGIIADANTLLRKYRDDLFFYLYLLFINEKANHFDNKKISEHEKNIFNWKNNLLEDLYISKILMYIASDKIISESVEKFNLKNSLIKIGKNLNNFVHGNGIEYYNKYYFFYQEKGIKKSKELTDKFIYNINYITTVFIFLLALINGKYISSSDYIDYLECNLTPPEGSQYWVAPFISEFIIKNQNLISKECLNFLKENTSMIF
jgi:hypothetical protein